MNLITDEDRQALRDAMKDFDISAAMRLAFGKCPECRTALVQGWWLEMCPDRRCPGYVGPKRTRNKDLQGFTPVQLGFEPVGYLDKTDEPPVEPPADLIPWPETP